MAAKKGFEILRNYVKRNIFNIYKSRKLPGSISISNKLFVDLEIIKDHYKPGMTKAGSVSLVGTCNGQKAKIYSTRSAAQSALIQEVSNRLEDFTISLPKIIARDEKYIAEEWVEGVIGTKVVKSNLICAVESLLEKFKTDFADLNEDKRFEGSFDYLEDYLLKRIEPWLGYCDLSYIKDDWQDNFLKAKSRLTNSLSHPDLTLSNMIFSDTGKILVVDNELVGIGLGWILDIYNSRLDITETRKLTQFETDFRDRSIFLREIGSAIDSGKFLVVERLVNEYRQKFF